MATSTSPLRELAEALGDARDVRLHAKFVLPGGKALWIVTSGPGAGRRREVVNGYCKPENKVRGHETSPVFRSLASAWKHAAAKYPKAVLRPETVDVSMPEGTAVGEPLAPLAVRAWHEAFGRPIPTPQEAAAAIKAALAEKQEADRRLVARLKSDPTAVQEFNALPRREREAIDLRRADLAGATIDGIQFTEMNLEGADLTWASLVGACLSGARLKDAKLVDTRCSRADLTGVAASGTDLGRADLAGAVLCRADLRGADLSGADLTDADLTGADLRAANLDGATLGGPTLARARYDRRTRWPEGFAGAMGLLWKGNDVDPQLALAWPDGSVPPSADFAGFLVGLGKVADSSKLEKALAMLKADRFQLFAKVDGDRLVGVVRSQSQSDLVYACRLSADGHYGCCTQNLNICGGLRGSPCKHLLVLILGLARAGQIDPATAHAWVLASRGLKAELDRDATTQTLLEYKGAEAGEVDWRPTETIPEDFYAL